MTESKMNSWKTFLAGITKQSVWKKIYTNEVKSDFIKRLEISGIGVYPGHFTASFQDITDAILNKSFPRDALSKDNPQHAVICLEAELDYRGKDDVLFSCTKIDCVIDNLCLNKSPGIDR